MTAVNWSSEVDVCNAALLMCGGKAITSLTQANSTEAKLSNLFYANARDAALRAYPWNFAKKLAVLSTLTGTPDFEYSVRFQLPDDFLKLRYIHDRSIGHKVIGNELHADSDTIKIAYTARITDVRLFDSLFVNVLASKLASMLAYPLTRSKTNVQVMIQIYDKFMQEAQEIDSQEGTADDIMSDDLIDPRYGSEGSWYGY